MTPYLHDLFGVIPVTADEIDIWIDIVPGWNRTAGAARRAYYARCWNVAEKIRQAKASGFWVRVEAAKREQLDQVGAIASGPRLQ
jgi:hypothetical protein